MNKRASVPILITWDVDPDQWFPEESRRLAINTAMDACHENGIPATFFITAKGAELYRDDFEKLCGQSHEVGCHGLTHGTEENYDRMPEEQQDSYIAQATEKLQSLTGRPIRAFRGPRVKTSATTLKLLAKHGYLADSSVCSQRMDVVSSNLINTGWLFAPRRPYRPHPNNAYKAGDLPLWEIPVSAIILPFISTIMMAFGPKTLKTLCWLLYMESRRTGKPIVYLAHPTELVSIHGPSKKEKFRRALKPEHLSPTYIRAHGLRLRDLLYRMKADELVKATREILAYMATLPDVEFMTVSNYTLTHLGEITPQKNGNSRSLEQH